MVSFQCEGCCDTMTKKKLRNHANTCPYFTTFSCIDCHTVFNGREWEHHTSCMSEAQRYHGKFAQYAKKGAPGAPGRKDMQQNRQQQQQQQQQQRSQAAGRGDGPAKEDVNASLGKRAREDDKDRVGKLQKIDEGDDTSAAKEKKQKKEKKKKKE